MEFTCNFGKNVLQCPQKENKDIGFMKAIGQALSKPIGFVGIVFALNFCSTVPVVAMYIVIYYVIR